MRLPAHAAPVPLNESVPARRFPRHAWPCVAAVVFVLAMVATRWDTRTGFTSLLRFGDDFDGHRIPELADLPLLVRPHRGYDGQFYAQIAVSPTPNVPALHDSLDNPAYRTRRILLPAFCHVLGAGDAWRVLHVYALSNVVCWLVTCWLFWRIIEPTDWRGTAVWCGCMLGLGVLDSVRMALTDLPALLLTTLAVVLATRGRRTSALGVFLTAVFVRETALLSIGALDSRPWSDRASWRTHALNAFLVATPLAIWTLWLVRTMPSEDPLGAANFDWPLAAMTRHAVIWIRALAAGDFDSRNTFGLLAIVSMSWQAIDVLRRRNSTSPWLRLGLPFAVLFWFLGDAVWHGYWAVARACLPMTVAYNLSLPRDRSFAWRWTLGNVCLWHGLYRLLPEL